LLGYDLLESLTLLSKEEIEELSISIKMLPGHKRRFPAAIQKAREHMQEQKEIRKRERAKLERERGREEAKREREEEKRESEEKDQEEKQKRERRVAQELADIEAEQKLAQAKARSIKDPTINADSQHTKSTTHNSTGLAIPASKSKIEIKGVDLPANKSYAAFISHKKAHSKHGEISETLAIRLKVCSSCSLLILFSTIACLYCLGHA
jgi:hypothetical protein